ncbi:MAG: FliO/MopB family protein [Rhodospirillales bacterium]|nr:FliO/MopB family protein [Alphaproteobacteria bacterium]USO02972.1 MAG: FliO/MopB family protein [Rhodospirillales bacterium]
MEITELAKFAASLLFVLALMGGLAFIIRRFGLGQAGRFISTEKKQLRIIETLPLDARRKLVLLERGPNRHLVILGPSGETVIETNITAEDDDDKK